MFQQLLGFEDDILVDPLGRRLTAGVFHDFGKVFWRDAELVGIKTHIAFRVVVLADQVDESLKYNFVTGGDRLLHLALFCHTLVDETPEDEKHRGDEMADALACVGVIGVDGRVDELDVLLHDGEFVGFQGDARVVQYLHGLVQHLRDVGAEMGEKL